MRSTRPFLLVCLACLLLGQTLGAAEVDDSAATIDESESSQPAKEELSDEDSQLLDHFGGLPRPPKLPPPQGLKQMAKPNRVWIDMKQRQVVVDGYVSLQEGMLEMFACPVATKEHESVVAVYAWPQVVHAALLAVGAKAGKPVQFRPKFVPPSGTEVAIEVRWLDEKKKWQTARAQDWVKNGRTGKPMKHPWVFAGSGFWKDEESDREYYMGDSGDFICVSNFSTATLDVPIESSDAANGLIYEAMTKQIPPMGTPVRLVLKPKIKEKPADAKKQQPAKDPQPVKPKLDAKQDSSSKKPD